MSSFLSPPLPPEFRNNLQWKSKQGFLNGFSQSSDGEQEKSMAHEDKGQEGSQRDPAAAHTGVL